MNHQFKMVKLGEVADFINGVAFKPEDWEQDGLPIIRIQNLNDPTKPYNFTNRKVKKDNLANKGDLLVSWSASLGVYEWLGDTACINQHIFKVIPNLEKVDKSYLKRVLQNSIAIMESQVHGATMKHITRGKFLAIQIPLPPLPTQTHIAHLLDRADELRQKRQTAIKKLDDLLQATFIKMFGNLDEYKNSNIKLSDISKINPRIEQNNIDENSLVAFMPMADVMSDEYFAKNKAQRPYGEVKKGFTFFRQNDILLAKITPCFENGKIAIANIDTNIGFGSTEFHVIRANQEKYACFICIFLKQHWIREVGEKQMTGSAGQKRVPKSFVEDLPIPFISEDDLDAFNRIFNLIQSQKAKLQAQADELETLFLALQQKAFNGEITHD